MTYIDIVKHTFNLQMEISVQSDPAELPRETREHSQVLALLLNTSPAENSQNVQHGRQPANQATGNTYVVLSRKCHRTSLF